MDIQHLSLEQLLHLQKQVAAEIGNRRVADELKILDEIRQKVAYLGLSPEDLASRLQGRAKRTVAPQFRDPASGALWSGRGRKPRWVDAWLNSGRALDELRI